MSGAMNGSSREISLLRADSGLIVAFHPMNQPDTNDNVVIITGAAGGLGRALVETFRAANWRVAAGQHRNSIFEESDDLLPVSMNVTKREEIEQAVQATLAKWGRIDALINNAGITADASVVHLRNADWQRVLDVNLKGAFLCSQAVIQPMFKQRDGHIINISSFAAKNGHAGQSNYVAAKAGLIGLTQSLAKEAGARNIRVNAIFPGVLDTPMTADLTEEQREQLASTNVLGRSTTVGEVSQFILHLAQMKHVSGQVFPLDSRVGAWT
jgi:3-oxoacyl-[acyl-carrier protein] reductase